MAKDYKKIYEKRYGKTNTEDDLQSQVNNLKARLEAGGVKNPKVDDRNALERWLNLEQDQGLIGDVFELLGRPQQALFTGIKNSQEGGSFLEGMKEGITGKEDTEFKEVLMNTGAFEDEKGKLNLVDALGFAGDVLLDPLDLALIPVTGGASVAVGAVDTAGDAAKATKSLKSVNDLLFEGAGKVAKKGSKIADTGIEKGLKKLDEARGVIYKNPTAKWASELGKIGDNKSLINLETYKGLKNNLTTMFSTRLSKNARKSKKVNDAIEHNVRVYLENKAEGLNEMVKTVATKLGKNADDVAKDIQKITDKVDDISISDIIEGAKNGTVKYSDEVVNALNVIANDVPQLSSLLKKGITKADNGALQLSEEWFSNLDKFDAEKISDLKVKRTSWLSDSELKEIEDLIETL